MRKSLEKHSVGKHLNICAEIFSFYYSFYHHQNVKFTLLNSQLFK